MTTTTLDTKQLDDDTTVALEVPKNRREWSKAIIKSTKDTDVVTRFFEKIKETLHQLGKGAIVHAVNDDMMEVRFRGISPLAVVSLFREALGLPAPPPIAG